MLSEENLNQEIDLIIKNAIREDVGSGDHSSLACIPTSATGKAKLLVKDKGIIAGIAIARKIFDEVDRELQIEYLKEDGEAIQNGDIAFFVSGRTQSILKAERLVLNTMQRMSAIATKTRDFAEVLQGTKTKILDTRKTTPGFRAMEKIAVKLGGGVNHRFALYDMIMLKDNHIDFAGGIPAAIAKTKDYLQQNNLDLKMVVEARDLQEVDQILDAGGVHRILLDNFDYDTTREAVQRIGTLCQTESSGGITLKTAREYANCGVDYISSGALTHSIYNMDLSLKAV